MRDDPDDQHIDGSAGGRDGGSPDGVLGTDGQTGPSPTDAVLVVVGLGTIVTAQLAGWADGISLVGVGLVGLGLVVPLRTVRQRFSERR